MGTQNFTRTDIKEIKGQYRLLNSNTLKKREFKEKGLNKRIEYQRDYTRILYSSAFRRLQGKMQILGIESTAFYRNRLTHSLEVAQIARSIAVDLADKCKIPMYTLDNDIYVVEAASLAHDIGHPPFGHKGEEILDNICMHIRFEGNAQNFRVLRRLEKKGYFYDGLNLTNRVLLAINKYIIKESSKKNIKKFLYKEDFEYLYNIRKGANIQKTRTLDVQIVDIADEIAYAVHDLEDALSLKYFDLDEFTYDMKKVNPNSCKHLEHFIKEARKYAMKSTKRETIQEFSQVLRKRMTSTLTHNLINDVSLSEVTEEESKKNGTIVGHKELSLKKYKQFSKDLKSVIFNCISRYQDIALYEKKGEIVLKELFNIYKETPNLLPPDYRLDDDNERNVIDYISGMMDTFAISEYERLTGKSFSDIKPTST